MGMGTRNLVSALPAPRRVEWGHCSLHMSGENKGDGEAGFGLSSLHRVIWKGKQEEMGKKTKNTEWLSLFYWGFIKSLGLVKSWCYRDQQETPSSSVSGEKTYASLYLHFILIIYVFIWLLVNLSWRISQTEKKSQGNATHRPPVPVGWPWKLPLGLRQW